LLANVFAIEIVAAMSRTASRNWECRSERWSLDFTHRRST
jgi:hypothetical protein